MKDVFIEDGYVINRDKKCLYCGACEVVKLDEGVSNLAENQFGVILCKDAKQCHQNIEAETSYIEIQVADDSTTLRDRYGNEITFLDNPQPQFTDKDPYDDYFGMSDGDDDYDTF